MASGRRRTGRMVTAGWAGMLLCLAGICAAQETPRQPESGPARSTEAPRPVPGTTTAPAALPTGFPEGAVGLTLLDALRLGELANLDIAQARAVVAQTLAARQRARVLWLPNVTAGSTYVYHDGRIQNTAGPIADVNRDSLFVGGGPSVAIGLSDALFAPKVANQIVEAARAGEQRVTNDTLLAVAEGYFAVLRGVRRVARIDEVLYYLTSPVEIPQTGKSKGLYLTIRAFVQLGQTPPPEQARVEVEIVRRREERAFAVQDLRFNIAELARLIRVDPQLPLWPLDDPRWATPIPGDAWLDCTVDELVRFALANRPELAETLALVRAAEERIGQARFRPLLPNFVTNYAAGGFGGAPNQIGTTRTGRAIMSASGRIQQFGNRDDWDISLLWRLNNLGFGNVAEIREQRALLTQAELRALQTRDRVVAQVVQAVVLVEQAAQRVRLLQDGLFDERGRPGGPVFRSLRLNFTRLQLGELRPLEVLDSIRSLSDVREAYVNALTDYERARFRLLVALGIPAPGMLDPRLMPVPPSRAQCRIEPPRTPAPTTDKTEEKKTSSLPPVAPVKIKGVVKDPRGAGG